MTDITIQGIVEQWLKTNGYDGLYCPSECACRVGDLMPCSEPGTACIAGVLATCDGSCGEGGCDFHIVAKQQRGPTMTDERPETNAEQTVRMTDAQAAAWAAENIMGGAGPTMNQTPGGTWTRLRDTGCWESAPSWCWFRPLTDANDAEAMLAAWCSVDSGRSFCHLGWNTDGTFYHTVTCYEDGQGQEDGYEEGMASEFAPAAFNAVCAAEGG